MIGCSFRQACNAFQSAAGAFAYLKDNAAARATASGATTVDLSVESAGMLEKLMLAQAQECFFEKVIGDAKPPVICSKVARQVNIPLGLLLVVLKLIFFESLDAPRSLAR